MAIDGFTAEISAPMKSTNLSHSLSSSVIGQYVNRMQINRRLRMAFWKNNGLRGFAQEIFALILKKQTHLLRCTDLSINWVIMRFSGEEFTSREVIWLLMLSDVCYGDKDGDLPGGKPNCKSISQ